MDSGWVNFGWGREWDIEELVKIGRGRGVIGWRVLGLVGKGG